MSKHALHQRNMVTALVLLAITCAVATSVFIWRARHAAHPVMPTQVTTEQGVPADGR